MEGDSRCGRLCQWFRGPLFLLYVNYFSVTWGNRMWNFALGLFFMNIADEELRLIAIYGFTMGGSVLLLGGVVGNWVDRTNRLTAVRTSIIVQKVSVSLCGVVICLMLLFKAEVHSVWDGWLYIIGQVLVVILAVLAELATMSYLRIELEKDWFVVVTEGKKSKLANLNASTRAVDLITNTVSPIVTGQIMTSSSQVIAAITIVVWHLAAIVIEFLLLTRIYNKVPKMAQKESDGTEAEKEPMNLTGDSEMVKKESPDTVNGHTKQSEKEDDRNQNGCCHMICTPCCMLWNGWKTYARQMVVFAGLALSFLYMTVLGFDGVTVGYIYRNGVQENLVGVAMAVGSLAGVLGAFLYTQFRKCIGLERTGLLSMTWQVSCLALCVFSLWLPGSLFNPEALWKGHQDKGEGQQTGCNDTDLYVKGNESYSDAMTFFNSSINYANGTRNVTNCCETEGDGSVMTQSIIVFLIGITSSRIGLYVTDLVICQIQQENVPEKERGIVNGVQNSLNNLMDMFKYILVMILPRIETFGYLILLSFVFIVLAGLLYDYHCFRVSKHSISRCLRGKTDNANKDVIEVHV